MIQILQVHWPFASLMGPLVTESVQHIQIISLPLGKQRYRNLNSVNNVLNLNC